jgi:CRP-like cAMP-binding protein
MPVDSPVDEIVDFQEMYNALEESDRRKVDEASERLWCYAGDELIHQDHASDAVFIIEEGAVEVLIETASAKSTPPLTYLGRGDIIGELGVLNQRSRSATVRAASDVFYRRLESPQFLQLLNQIPRFGAFIAHRLAMRLANTTTSMAFNSVCMDLSGKLPQFDLMAVFFTIASSGVTGELRIVDENRENIGNFFFNQGCLLHARFRQLQGLEAAWQVFIEDDLNGAFSFKHSNVASRPVDEGFETDVGVDDLLMQAAVKRDEFHGFIDPLRKLFGGIERVAESFRWDEPDTEYEARCIYDLCERGNPSIQSVWTRSGLSQVTFGKIVTSLTDQNVLRLTPRHQ